MDEFDGVIKKATDVFYSMVRKSGEIVESTRVSYNISVEKDKITRLQCKIGAKLYKMYKNGEDTPEMFLEDFKAIKALEENIANLEKNVAESKTYIICTECSSKLSANSVYCPKCRTKQQSAD